MPKVYSYLRFSDPKQSAGSSADRQAEYARRWAAAHNLVLDEALSMRDEGLSGYHQRHVTHGALGVFLRAVEDGRIEAGSFLIVEGLDRLSRAEPILAQAQLAQIINAGITVVTASDSKEYNREKLKAQPMDLVYSLLVMIRAHEESDTKSKRVRAAIRRQCEAWQAGTFRGPIRNGKDPHWVRWEDGKWVLIESRAEAMRFAITMQMKGMSALRIMREMAARKMTFTDSGKLNSGSLYRTLRKRLLVGERELDVGGETWRLANYYPALITEAEFDALQLVMERRGGKRGVGEIPSIITGMGIAVCGYCGGAIVSQNLMGRKRQPDGNPWPGHRRMVCTHNANGYGCAVRGSIQSAPIERALMIYCCDQMRIDALMQGGDVAQGQRAAIAAGRLRIAAAQTKLDRITKALATDDGAIPITLLREMRTLEASLITEREAIEAIERELASYRPAATPDMAQRWLTLIDGVESLNTDARLEARELVRASFTRITVWLAGDPATPGGGFLDMEITARSGGVQRLRVDRSSGRLLG